ncbi:MAG: hypothetical protein ABGW74_03900 [Campylobacterales bacterium]
MTKISLYVNGRSFDLNIEDDFLPFLEKEMSKDFNLDGNIDSKTLLNSYLKKTHRLFKKEKEIENILKKFR